MSSRRTFLAAAAGILCLAGAGIAVAATHGNGGSSTTAAGVPAVLTHGTPHGARPFGFGFRRGGPGGELEAAASYLGITTQQLLTDLRSGKTLAQIADGTSGKSAAGLVQALVTHEKQELKDAV